MEGGRSNQCCRDAGRNLLQGRTDPMDPDVAVGSIGCRQPSIALLMTTVLFTMQNTLSDFTHLCLFVWLVPMVATVLC